MSITYSISERDFRLLTRFVEGEIQQRIENPYNSFNYGEDAATEAVTKGRLLLYLGGTSDVPDLVSMTVGQIIEIHQLLFNISSAGAAGRYQIVSRTLGGVIERDGTEVIGLVQNELKNNRSYLFDVTTQDFLGLRLLERRGLREWERGELKSDRFLYNLSQEWAAIPVPYIENLVDERGMMPGAKGRVWPGQSFYTGIAGNKSGGSTHNAYIAFLESERLRGPGETQHRSLGVSSTPFPPDGTDNFRKLLTASGGGQDPQAGSPYNARARVTSRGLPTNLETLFENGRPNTNVLPAAYTPYKYEIIDPLDNRYDFRTGKKVKDFAINGIAPMSSTGLLNNNGLPPDDEFGSPGYTDSQRNEITINNPVIGYGPGQVYPSFAKSLGIPSRIPAPVSDGHEGGMIDLRLPRGSDISQRPNINSPVTSGYSSGPRLEQPAQNVKSLPKFDLTAPPEPGVSQLENLFSNFFSTNSKDKTPQSPASRIITDRFKTPPVGDPDIPEPTINPNDYIVSLITEENTEILAQISKIETDDYRRPGTPLRKSLGVYREGDLFKEIAITEIDPEAGTVTLEDGSVISKKG